MPRFLTNTINVYDNGEVEIIPAPVTPTPTPIPIPTPIPTPTPMPIPTPTPTPPNPGEPPVPLYGFNLERPTWLNRTHYWGDCIKSSAFMGPAGGSSQPPYGPNGWPSGDFDVTLIDDSGPSDVGLYSVVYRGKFGTIKAAQCTVSAPVYDPASDVTRCTVDYHGHPASLVLAFTGVVNCNGLRVLRPGVTEGDANVFSPDFRAMLAAVRPAVLRGMDFQATNSSPISTWASRPKRPSITYATTGGTIEDLVDMCNLSGAQLWLCLPYQATADYIQGAANLIASTLRADLAIYVEWSNEVWNSSTKFAQHAYNVTLAAAERKAGTPYNANDEVAGWQRTGYQIAKFGRVFRDAFVAAGRSAAQVRPLLCGWGNRPETLTWGMDWIKSTLGTPSDWIWGVAIAPYSALLPMMTAADWQVNVLQGDHVNAMFSVAASYGVRGCAYEGGVDGEGYTGTPAAFEAAQEDPRMENVTSMYLAGWPKNRPVSAVGPFVYYTLAQRLNGLHSYGATTDVRALTAPKLNAVVKAGA